MDTQDVSMDLVIRRFAELYLESDDDIEPTGDISEIESNLVETYAFHREHSIGNDEIAKYTVEGMFINRDDFRKRGPQFVDYHRGYMLAETAIKHVLPPAFKEFLKYFPKGANLRGVNMEFLSSLGVMDDELGYPPEPVIDPATTTGDEWICFFRDGLSVDNGQGAIYVNGNSASPYFGRLAILSSSDDMCILITEYQFDDWLEIMVANAPLLLSMHSDSADKRRSVVDFFNGFSHLGSENFHCDDYFEARGNEVRRVFNELKCIPKEICNIVAEYIIYRNMSVYQGIPWGDDHEHMRLLGATDEMIDD